MNDRGIETKNRSDSESSWRTIFNIPNQLTIARLLLSVLFFALLVFVGREASATDSGERSLLLNIALAVFCLAVSTDFLDGYLARKWKLASTFGRIADPFVDKIVICGGFIMLIGVAPDLIRPWYAVLIVFREFLVSGLRSFLESRGVAFGASWSGKLKMLLQSITIPAVLCYEANFEQQNVAGLAAAAYHVTVSLLVLTLLLTLGSSVGYVQRAVKLFRESSVR